MKKKTKYTKTFLLKLKNEQHHKAKMKSVKRGIPMADYFRELIDKDNDDD